MLPESQLEPAQTESTDSDPEHLTFGQHVAAFFKELTVVVVGAIIVASILRGFVGQMFLIPSVSMENTLQVDDRVVVEKLSTVRRGQVIVFKDPGGWFTGPAVRERGPNMAHIHRRDRCLSLPLMKLDRTCWFRRAEGRI